MTYFFLINDVINDVVISAVKAFVMTSHLTPCRHKQRLCNLLPRDVVITINDVVNDDRNDVDNYNKKTCRRCGQVWAQGCKPVNAPASDIEASHNTWGVGANIVTKLVNQTGEVNRFV